MNPPLSKLTVLKQYHNIINLCTGGVPITVWALHGAAEIYVHKFYSFKIQVVFELHYHCLQLEIKYDIFQKANFKDGFTLRSTENVSLQ